MAVTDTLRPTSVVKTGGASVVPSGTLNGVTSDNSDSTYVNFSVANSGNNYSLRVGSHTPPANHQRHRIRGRMRARTDAGTVYEDIDLGRGAAYFIRYKTVTVGAAFAEYVTDWYQEPDYGLAQAGALADLNVGGGWVNNPLSGATALRTAELYVDIDNRQRPTYAPEIRDAAGVDQAGGTITDTTQPTLYFGGVNYDGLPALDWRVEIGSFVASGSGTPPTSVPVTTNLADGLYSATFRVRSTIRGSDPFEWTQVLAVTIENVQPVPSPPLVSITEQDGGYLVTWEDPGGQTWDNGYVVAEVWRDDCNGSWRIASVPDGINGSYLDLAIPQLDPQHVNVLGVCEVHAGECSITYRVRYWGYVSSYVELPDTLPQDLILAWPSTAGTIPSGWTRVTALDGYFPRGATGTGTPSATGGTASHSHTTSGHLHVINSHAHPLDGSTGSSNSSATSARYNGASLDQAGQPHSHSRPDDVNPRAGQNSGAAFPGTNTISNDPPHLTVIWIESDGSQTEYPIGVLGWAAEQVSGWEDSTLATGRFLRGAAGGANGGAQAGVASHGHTVAAHTHTGFTHSHGVSNTGQSTPVGTDAGTGSSTPRFLARHTHPMDVADAATGSLVSTSGGGTSAPNHEPPNRRLRVLANTGGGIQTRIIGLYLGAISGLDPLLVHCNGSNGTPDMRGYFARDNGADSVNSTGGSSTHGHTGVGSHTHTLPGHSHATSVLASQSTSYLAPTFGDLGDSPSTGHTHTSGATTTIAPSAQGSGTGSTDTVNHLPVYREAHFVRLDGVISGGPLPVPELRVSEFASSSVPAFTYVDELDRLATLTDQIAIPTDRTHGFPRLTVDSVPLDGGLHAVSTTLAGEDASLTIVVVGQPAIDDLEEILANRLVYWSPLGGTAGWFAPGGWNVRSGPPNVKIVTVPMVRQDWPPVDPPEVYL